MASKFKVVKNIYNRISINNINLKKQNYISNILKDDAYIPIMDKTLVFNELDIVRKNRIRNTCIFTGRARAVFSKWRLTRMAFKTLASNGYLPGVKRLGW